MAVGSGLGGSVGLVAESTYGTYVAPTRWHEITKESLARTKNVVQGGGIAGGRLQQLGSRRVVTTVAGSGSIDLEVANIKMGLLLNHLTGGTSTIVQQSATTAWLQTHTFSDNIGKSLTVQKGIVDTTGTVTPFSFLGGKVTAASFTCGVNTLLTSSWDFDFKDVTEAQSLAAPSYTAAQSPFHGGQMNVKTGTFGGETDATGVTKVDVKIERPQATDRYYAQSAGAPGTKLEPIINDYVKITGSIEQDLTSKTLFADRFRDDSSTSLVLEWVGPIIASTFKQTFRLKIPMVFFDTQTPDIDGPDVTDGKYNFTAQFDGTNAPLIIEYMSTDITI